MKLYLTGQIKSGKNHMMIDPRTGRHYPNKSFKEWRDAAMKQILGQIPRSFQTLEVPCHVSVFYTPADRRKRDVPGLIDALCHVLEKVGVVKDDALFVSWNWRPVTGNPGVAIEINPIDPLTNPLP